MYLKFGEGGGGTVNMNLEKAQGWHSSRTPSACERLRNSFCTRKPDQTVLIMQSLLERLKDVRLTTRNTSHSYSPAWPLQEENIARPVFDPQRDCPLLQKLSLELRIIIYRLVLSNSSQFLHICLNDRQAKRNRKRRRVAHFRCVENDSPFPTWQHMCYGEKITDHPRGLSSWSPRVVTETDDKLLSLLLTCRLM